MTGADRAAALLVALGQERAAEVLSRLSADDIGLLAWSVAGIDKLRPDERARAFDEFYAGLTEHSAVARGGPEAAFALLERAFGEERARDLQRGLGSKGRGRPFRFLTHIEPKSVVGLLGDEHPQALAILIGMVPVDYAAALVMELDEALQVEVLSRLAALEKPPAESVEVLEQALSSRAGGLLDRAAVDPRPDGAAHLAELLRRMDVTLEKDLLDGIEAINPALAAALREQMFMFEHLVQLDDRSIQRVLRDVQSHDLAVALRGASEELRSAVLRNMSTRAAAMLEEDMQAGGPVRRSVMREAQARIVAVVRKLEEAEEIVINLGEDELVA